MVSTSALDPISLAASIYSEDDRPIRFRGFLVELANLQKVLPGVLEILVPHLDLIAILRLKLIVAIPHPLPGNLGKRRRDVLHLRSGDIGDGVITPAKELAASANAVVQRVFAADVQ